MKVFETEYQIENDEKAMDKTAALNICKDLFLMATADVYVQGTGEFEKVLGSLRR